MKRRILWVLATILVICGASVFTACSSNDDNSPSEDAFTPLSGDTWDAAKHTFTWQGTPSTTVGMIASEDIELKHIQIRFTVD